MNEQNDAGNEDDDEEKQQLNDQNNESEIIDFNDHLPLIQDTPKVGFNEEEIEAAREKLLKTADKISIDVDIEVAPSDVNNVGQ